MTCSLYLSSVEKFWPTPLYKASMYIDSAFFFTQQFTLYSCSRSQRYSLWHSSVFAFLDTSQVSPLLVLHSAGRQMRSLRTTKIHTVRFSPSTVQEFQVHSRLPRRQHSRPRLLRLRRVKSTVPKKGGRSMRDWSGLSGGSVVVRDFFEIRDLYIKIWDLQECVFALSRISPSRR
jgi:hypothetical protein